MFPATPAQDLNEVERYMLGLGATVDYESSEVISSHAWGADETDERYVFRFGSDDMGDVDYIQPMILAFRRFDNIKDDLFTTNWITPLCEDILFLRNRKDGGERLHGGDYSLLDSFVRVLEHEGIERRLTARIIVLWHSIRENDRDNLFETEARTFFTYCAQVAAIDALDTAQQIDCVLRNIPVGHLTDLLGRGIQYSLIADMYPVVLPARALV